MEDNKIKQGQIQIELEKQLKVICELEDRFADLNNRLEYVLINENPSEKTDDEKERTELVQIASMIRNNTKRMLSLSYRIRNTYERVEV